MSGAAIEKVPLQALVSLNREEVDLAISTAKQFPRNIERAVDVTTALVTRDPAFTALCVYAILRGGKIIEGPSVRFAECLAHSWGNLTVGARVAEEQANHVVAQGVAHDLETNTRYSFEVKRRITDKDGNRYNQDMIATTGNAACAIALRNAILRTVPRALWGPIYDEARRVIGGKKNPANSKETAEVAEKRTKAIEFLRERWQITEEQILKILHLDHIVDIGADEIVSLRGLATALQDGDITVEQAVSHSKTIPKMPKPTKPKKGKAPKASTRSAPAAGAESKGAAGASTKPKRPIMETEYVDPKKSECPECGCSFKVHLKTCSKFKDPHQKAVQIITKNQYMDLLIWLGEHGLQAVDARQAAIKLGYNGPTKDLPAALLPKIYEAFADRK